MVQILINLIAGALGGAAIGKSSPTFDLGTVGNIISVGRWRSARPDRYVGPAVDPGGSPVRQFERWRRDLSAGRGWRWRSHTHGDHWGNQKQSNGLTLASAKATWVPVPISLQQLADQVIRET